MHSTNYIYMHIAHWLPHPPRVFFCTQFYSIQRDILEDSAALRKKNKHRDTLNFPADRSKRPSLNVTLLTFLCAYY
jgi:hypothetical protein